MRVLILLTSLLLQQVTDNINAATMRTEQDPVRIEQLCTLSENGSNAIVYLLELFFKTPVTEEEIAGILSLQKSDGSFRDVDYADPAFSQCSQGIRSRPAPLQGRNEPPGVAVGIDHHAQGAAQPDGTESGVGVR